MDSMETYPKNSAARLVTGDDASSSTGTTASKATLAGAADPYELDRLLHAQQARLTSGLSLSSCWLAWADWAIHLANAPARRADLGRKALEQWHRYLDAAAGAHVIDTTPQDHRFRSPLWQRPPYNLLYQGFLLAEEWWGQASDGGPAVGRHNQQIVSFAARQWLDVFSPSNIPWLNPEVIEETAATGGRNFQLGVQNFLNDLRETQNDIPSETRHFKLGEGLAVTPGKVVLRNALIELIQYAPMTDRVRPEPVLIVPAWIMKYYILDLSPQDSLIRYLVGQGYTVFAISWKNPGPELRDMGMDDYRRLGPMAALDAIGAICGDTPVHGCGYCLGGTLLSITAAAMARDQDQRLKSLTLFAAQTDFTEAGELQLFISEGQLSFLEDVMAVHGTLDSRQMAGAFQMLRSNDLVWSRLINSYLLGRTEADSDLMAWNADGTRMPARMHSQYLRRLFLDNDLAEGRFVVDGRPVSLSDIHVPIFVVGTETDHIAPWHSVYKLHSLSPAEITFVLTSGGHNAGIVSEPGHPHRSFRSLTRIPGSPYQGPEEWHQTAKPQEGSWWPFWVDWLGERSHEAGSPPALGAPKKGYGVLGDAPGTYVFEH
ncbi:MAG: polyhydroxyalkanoic acid synthase [Rhodospirillales bacterium]|nr:polyhydroxyalkanoic acid synthase [Rhodospirillales bacterium]